jgi:hypothetical protein
MGQERLLPPETVRFASVTGRSASSDHDHCEFCSVKFMDRESSTEPALTEEYTTTTEHVHGAGYHWVCVECATDFAEGFGWILVER